MTSEDRNPLLIVIVGPTGSGKTALSLALAQHLAAEKLGGAEIVSCDSVAVYREFEIGTAKPSLEQRELVPHHLIDVASPSELCTAGEYARQARIALREICARGKIPVVVGGTGLYLRAMIHGLFAGPQRSEELRARLRTRAASKGTASLHALLCRLDAETAAKVHPHDLPKVIRAIEVCLSAKGKMSEMWERGREALAGFRIVQIGLNPDRAALYERINRRSVEMFKRGLIEETRMLLKKYGEAEKEPNHPLNSLGYRQAAQFIRGEIGREEALAATQQAHRNYAKRQLTWFRKEKDVHWTVEFGDQDWALEFCKLIIGKCGS